jgi:predicted ribosome quality control (RQC) complex YloA/Tae2 family protein
MTKRLEILNNSNEFEEKANLIMSNLHIFKGQSEAEIFDYYKNENRIISIKKGMSPQKFAETLYRKNKNKGIEIKNLKGSIRKAEDTYIQNKNLLKQLSSIENSKELKTWVKSENLEKKKKITEETLPFKKFIFQGYDILVGQNSKKNDTLTTQYASKNDIWMHAKDVSGSHVVIKKQGLKNVPNDVLEEAASIAAWFSKGRTDTYFPVIYTERKYVRKSKGLAAGQVKVDQHDVLIVKPKKPE